MCCAHSMERQFGRYLMEHNSKGQQHCTQHKCCKDEVPTKNIFTCRNKNGLGKNPCTILRHVGSFWRFAVEWIILLKTMARSDSDI